MKLKEFVERFNGLPETERDFAYGAVDVEDEPDLRNAAEEFINAYDAFLNALDEVGVEIG